MLRWEHYRKILEGHRMTSEADPIPQYLRDAFREAVESFPEWWEYGGPEPAVRCGRGMSPISAVFRLVDQFKDQLPSELLDFILQIIGHGEEAFEMKRRGTYGA